MKVSTVTALPAYKALTTYSLFYLTMVNAINIKISPSKEYPINKQATPYYYLYDANTKEHHR